MITEGNVKITTHLGVDIEFNNETQQFEALPDGARKVRTSRDMYGIRSKIEDHHNQKQVAKRKPIKVRFRLWTRAVGAVFAHDYLGTRGKATGEFERGHAFKRICGKTWGRNSSYDAMHIVPDAVSLEGIEALEDAKAKVKAAEAHLLEMEKLYTIKVELPGVVWNPDVNSLQASQDKAEKLIRDAVTNPMNTEV